MSTNFYLHRDPHNCGECGKAKREAEVHIGKRSVGWVFTWQGFEADQSPGDGPLTDAETWRDFLGKEIAQGGWIEAEHGVKYTLDEFFGEVVAQRQNRRQSIEYPGHAHAAGADDVSYGEWC